MPILASGITINSESYHMKLSIISYFALPHNLYKAVSELMEAELLSEEVELDAMYFSINLKGIKPHNIPRLSKKRGNRSVYRGISHHKIFLTSAVDSNNNIIMRVTGLESKSFDKYKQNKRFFGDVKKVISDSKSNIKQFANHIKADYDNISASLIKKNYLTEDRSSLGTINEMMSEVRKMITVTKRFETRYLQGYLDFMLM